MSGGSDSDAPALHPEANEELVRKALADPDSEAAWRAIGILHAKGSRRELELARRLCASEEAAERRLGARILGQLGGAGVAFLEQSLMLLATLIEDPDPEVVAAAGQALGHRSHPRAIPRLVRLKDHPDLHVRAGVARALGDQEDDEAADALIGLSTDPVAKVREWATFGLASLSRADTAEIRRALRARVEDEDPAVRGEALIGLAERRASGVVEILTRELAGGLEGTWVLEAAAALADPRLLAPLEDLARRLPALERARYEDVLSGALRACGRRR